MLEVIIVVVVVFAVVFVGILFAMGGRSRESERLMEVTGTGQSIVPTYGRVRRRSSWSRP